MKFWPRYEKKKYFVVSQPVNMEIKIIYEVVNFTRKDINSLSGKDPQSRSMGIPLRDPMRVERVGPKPSPRKV